VTASAPGGTRRGRARGGQWLGFRSALTGALWPLPTAAIALALGLAVVLPELDRILQYGDQPLAYVFGGGPSAARTMLSAIASSLISVTTLLFSLTIVTLQLASSQYSPRLLQTFVRDRVVQSCLGVLLGTFVYALVVLRTVRSADESGAGAFVPRLSVTVAIVLTLASVAALVTFLSHQTRQLRVETMMRDVHVESADTIRRLGRQLAEDEQADAPLPDVPERARPVLARRSGFYVQLAEAPMLQAAVDCGAVLRLVARPGDAVIDGTPVAWAWADEPASQLPLDDLGAAVEQHLTVSHERSEVGDPSYGLRKLVDIAARALSPGINDPTTAVHALAHISDLLGALSVRDVWHRRTSDESGRERLLATSWEFGSLLDLAVTQIRHYGREDPTVMVRLFGVVAEVAWRARSNTQRAAVRHQRDLLLEQWESSPPAGRTVDDGHHWAETVDSALSGRRPRPGT
jgi:uncharacterized membrane protein